MSPWTIRITLLGRRNEGDVPGIGESRRVGRFDTREHAEGVAELWRADSSFLWQAEVEEGEPDRENPLLRRRPKRQRSYMRGGRWRHP